MIRIAVVEDESLYADQIMEYLKRYETEEKEGFEITLYRDGDGITSEYQAQFDIILMDIQMKFVDGMTAAEEIRRTDSEVIIIFITNLSQYAVRGYQVSAQNYVLKPITYFALSQELKKAIGRIRSRARSYIVLTLRDGIVRVAVEDIYYIESQGHYMIYHTAGGEYSVAETMKSAEKALTPYGFSRGNKGYLINLRHVDGIRDKCALVRDTMLPLSRSRIDAFMQDLTHYWGELK